MRHLHDTLRREHHMKHFARLQYGLFLKSIGVTLEQALTLWRTEFIKKMDPDKVCYLEQHTCNKCDGVILLKSVHVVCIQNHYYAQRNVVVTVGNQVCACKYDLTNRTVQQNCCIYKKAMCTSSWVCT